MASGEINATDLEQETLTSLDGSEQFVMFDTVKGKRAYVSTITDYVVTNGEVDGKPLPQIIDEVQNGEQPNLTAGSAEQLLSDNYTTDTAPYLFRANPTKSDREYDELIGGTVAWNQLVQNGDFADTNNWNLQNGTLTVENNIGKITSTNASAGQTIRKTASQISITKGHVYFASFSVKAETTGHNVRASLATETTTSDAFFAATEMPTSWTRLAGIAKSSMDNSSDRGFRIALTNATALSVNDYFSVKEVVCIDLTQMFGSAIADYIYSLEQATAGAGVAWFKKLFPKPYYAYNAGELISVKTSAHQMVGFNAWDEEWENGTINGQGQNASGTAVRAKNYVPILPSTSYYITPVMDGVFWYDADKNFISLNYSGGVRTSPSNAHYMRFYTQASYGSTYKNDICINLHWDGERDGDYEAYKKWTYPLDSDLELRGIPKLDSANNLYYDGDTYEDDGTVTRKYGIVDLGSLTWTAQTDAVGQYFRSAMPSDAMAINSGLANILCFKYVTTLSTSVADKQIAQGNGSGKLLYVRDTSYADADAFTTAMSGVYLVYELATPTTETADPYQNPQNAGATEEYIDGRTVEIPVGHETKYLENLKLKLEDLPALPTTAGTYRLKVTVSGGVPTYAWEAQ